MAISALVTIPIMECSLAVASSWMFLVNRDTSMIVYGFAKRYDVRTISKNSLEAEADEPEAAADVSVYRIFSAMSLLLWAALP